MEIATGIIVFAAGFAWGMAAVAVLANRAVGHIKADGDIADQLLVDRCAAEREIMLRAFRDERREWTEERRELCTRIQAYDPNPKPAEQESQPDENTDSRIPWTEEQLRAHGLQRLEDGVVYDPKTDAVWESFEDWRFWLGDLRKRGYPETLNPTVVDELGYGAALEEAKMRVAQAAKATTSKAAKAAGMKQEAE